MASTPQSRPRQQGPARSAYFQAACEGPQADAGARAVTAGMLLYLLVRGIWSALLALTGGAKALARKLENPGRLGLCRSGGPVGVVVLILASYPWASR
jgi:hypothetical protein